MKVSDVYDVLDSFAPVKTKMDFDNVGLLVGDPDAEVSNALIALDVTAEVISEATDIGAQLIVTHHPVIFDPLKSVRPDDIRSSRVYNLIRSNTAAICMHTNLDAAQGGVNDALAQKLELENLQILDVTSVAEGKNIGIGRYGICKIKTDFMGFLGFVKGVLNASGLRYCYAGKTPSKVAVGGGACGYALEKAIRAGCDTFITSDIKYDVFLDAKAGGINLIDAGHFCTENVVLPVIRNIISSGLPELNISLSRVHCQPDGYFM